MKKLLKIYTLFIIACTCLVFMQGEKVKASDSVDILFTGDLHSYLREYEENIDGQKKNVAGFARIKTYLDNERELKAEGLVFDCGEIVMGTLPQALMDTEACELSLLSDFGVDALTLGNHEFDYGAKALSDMYGNVADKKTKRPELVVCNIDWSQTDEYTTTLKSGLDKYGITDYVVFEKNGVKIAVTGVFGNDAQSCSPSCKLTFIDPVEAVKNTVDKIKKNENPDMIVLLSHSGADPLSDKDEDAVLAKSVPDLDVIISGHSHIKLDNAITYGNTHVIGCGCYGLYVGNASFKKNSAGRWDISSYGLKIMDENIPQDMEVEEQLDKYDDIIDSTVLDEYGLKARQVIARNPGIPFESVDDMYQIHDEMLLGNLLSDAYRYAADATPSGMEEPFLLAVAPSGTIRGTFPVGDITVSKAFEVLSLGIGPDGKVGYPLVSIYLTGKEIRTATEIDASISDLMKSARLYLSGISFEFNPKRLILNRTVDVWVSPAYLEQSRTELDDEKMYHVVTDSYSMSMLGAVTKMSKGVLSVVPKDADGNEVTDPMQCIIYDKDGNELKAWKALCDYLMTFEKDEDGISVIPDYYYIKQNRRVVNDSLSPRAMFKNTSKFFYIFVAILLLIIFLIIVIIRTIVKNKHKRKVYK